MLLPLRRLLTFPSRGPVAALAHSSRGASTVSDTTATGVNYFKAGEDPPLNKDSEYPEWLWSIADPPPSLFTLERKYTDEDPITDENFTEMKRLVKLQNIRGIKDVNTVKAKK